MEGLRLKDSTFYGPEITAGGMGSQRVKLVRSLRWTGVKGGVGRLCTDHNSRRPRGDAYAAPFAARRRGSGRDGMRSSVRRIYRGCY